MNKYPIKTVGEIVELHYGKGIARNERSVTGKYPIFGANGVLGHTDKYLIDSDVIIIGRKGSAGELTKTSGRSWPSDVTYYVKGNEVVDLDYLFYLFKKLNLPKLAVGVKPGINRNRVYEIEVPVPTISEQKKIVEKLEKLLAKLDRAKLLRHEAEQDTHHLFSSELRRILKESRRKGWQSWKLEDLTIDKKTGIKVGPFGSSLKKNELSSVGSVRVLFIENIVKNYFDDSKKKYITKHKYEELKSFTVEPGDILITMMGTIGRTGIVPSDIDQAIISSHLTRIRLDKSKVLPEYINAFLQSEELLAILFSEAKGAIMKGLNSKIIRELEFPVPPLAEQKKIISRLDLLLKNLNKIRFLQKTTQDRFGNLEGAILSAAFNEAFITSPIRVERKREEWFAIKQGVGAVLEKLAQTQFERGEMVIAKYTYFLQEIFKVPLGLHFVRHNFGPYDPDIKRAITASAFNKDKFFKVKGSGEQQVYSLGDNAEQLFKYSSHILRDSRAALSNLIKYTGSAKSVDIERLATVCKIIQDIKNTDIDKIMSEMQQWKGERFTKEQVKKTLEFIIQQGWNKALLN
jgi:type I restriction enzyme S subunit